MRMSPASVIAAWHPARCGAVLVAVLAVSAQVAAQDLEEGELINYGYAVWFGTGVYTVGDRQVAVMRVPFSWTMRAPPPQENKWGVKWLMPLTIGAHQFDLDFIDLDNTQTISFVPGVEVRRTFFDIWDIHPFAQFGVGRDFEGTELAYIYGGGAKSFINLTYGDLKYRIANRVLLAGQTLSESEENSGFNAFDAGVELLLPGAYDAGRYAINGRLFGILTWYGNRPEFLAPPGEDDKLSRTIEVGFSVGVNEGFSLWNLKVPRLGMSFIRGDGDFRAIRFNMGFPF